VGIVEELVEIWPNEVCDIIIVWKVAGEFVNPKYITVGSYVPMSIVNAAFHLSPSLILTLL